MSNDLFEDAQITENPVPEKKPMIRRVRRSKMVVAKAPRQTEEKAVDISEPVIEQQGIPPEESSAGQQSSEPVSQQEEGLPLAAPVSSSEDDFTGDEQVMRTISNPNQNNRRVYTNNNRNNNNRNNRNNNNTRPYPKNNIRSNNGPRRNEDYPQDINIEEHPEAAKLNVNDYSSLPVEELRKIGTERGVSAELILDMRKQEILAEMLKMHSSTGGVIVGSGTLEILPDGFGFLRSPNNSYLSGPEDIYISPAQVKSLSLKTGDVVYGQVRTPRDGERFFAILRILSVNGDAPIKAKTRASFESLTPLFPDRRIKLETTTEDMSMRIIDMFCPIGMGQRSLIIAPPRTGKTVLLQKIANSISANYPDVVLMVLLVDERPEEVTDMRRHVNGEVIASTFDEQASRHVQVAEMVIEKAKRLVEHKKDVVILLDSITRLARAYNQTVPASGKILSGGVDSNALHKPKRFFGAARNIEEGGSLTIIATGLIETGSRMDEVIFEEFKGTGNNEIILDRKLADRRIFPALNIKKSGTRRDDLLLPADEAARIWLCRNAVNDMDEQELTPFLIDKIRKTKDNEAFLRSINTDAQGAAASY
ncbi:MAG: transcription termination factor Rho [Sphaerochaetaceae bacterium]